MDFMIQNETKRLTKVIKNTVDETKDQLTHNYENAQKVWGSAVDTSGTFTTGAMSWRNSRTRNVVMGAFGGLPKPLLGTAEYYSYHIKEMANNKHLPQSMGEFIDVYNKQYVYHNPNINKLREVKFIDAVDADSSGTIGDHVDDEYAKIVISDLNNREITSFNFSADVISAEKFALFGSIYLGNDQILCAFRVNNSSNAQLQHGMILIKINATSDSIVFNSGIVKTPYGEVTRIAETDYNNKTIGFITNQISGYSSGNWDTAWTYVDYNWNTSVVDSFTGPFSSSRKLGEGAEAPNLGWKLGQNETSGYLNAIGAYHKDRGFGIRYKSFSNLNQNMGTRRLNPTTVHTEGQSLVMMNNKSISGSTAANYSSSLMTKSNQFSMLSNYAYNIDMMQRLYKPLGMTMPNHLSMTTASSWSKSFSWNSMNCMHVEPPVLNKRPTIAAYRNNFGGGGAANHSYTLWDMKSYGSYPATAPGMRSHQITYFTSSCAIKNPYMSIKQGVTPGVSLQYASIYARSSADTTYSRAGRRNMILDFYNRFPQFYTGSSISNNFGSWADAITMAPFITGLGHIACTGFDTFINYKDTYIGTSIDED